MLNRIVESIAASRSEEAELIVLSVLEDQHLFDFVDFHNAVDFLLPVVPEGVEIGCESDVIEKDIDHEGLLVLQLGLALEKWLQERPEDHLVDEAVQGASLLLVLEEGHFAGV